jgi:hypothetical protein
MSESQGLIEKELLKKTGEMKASEEAIKGAIEEIEEVIEETSTAFEREVSGPRHFDNTIRFK